MKKIVSIITALTVFAGSTFADEGMWLLPLLEKMNGKAMKEMGCELTPKQIYDINNTSLKDAIVQFGGGTGLITPALFYLGDAALGGLPGVHVNERLVGSVGQNNVRVIEVSPGTA